MPHFFILSLLLILISALPQSLWGYGADYYTSTSSLASGRWVKVSVDTTGIHQISYESLRSWGFDDPSKVTVHGYGAVMGADNTFGDYPDDLPLQHSLHTADGRILFYAEGPVSATVGIPTTSGTTVTRNYYSNRSYYFLTDCRTPEPAEPIEFVENPAYVMDNATFVDFREKETRNYGEGGALFHGPRIEKGKPDSYSFRVRNLNKGDVSVRIYGVLRIFSATKVKPEFTGQTGQVNFSPMGAQPVISNSKLWLPFSGSGSLSPTPDEPLQDARMTLNIPMPDNFQGSLLATDYLYYTYRRTLRMEPDEPQLMCQLNTQNVRNQNLVYSNAPEALQVWDVSRCWDVRPYAGNRRADQFTVTLPLRPNAPTRLVAFNAESTFAEPLFEGEVANQNLHALPVPDMVIITTPLFRQAAEELAEIDRARGMDVEVVMQSDIFNEFGSGAPSAAAIRRMNKMFFDRDNRSKFRFITIYGATVWDPRHITGPAPDYPLAYLAEEIVHAQESAANFANDAYFGMLSEGSTTSSIYHMNVDVTVGRIPARSQSDAYSYNNKVRKHLAAPPSPATFLRAINTSCDGDGYAHFDHNTALTDTLIAYNPMVIARRADELLFPARQSGKEWDAQRAIADAFTHGSGFFAYCGHGNPQALGNMLWDLRANKIYTNERYPLAMLATCYVIPIDREVGIGDLMLFKPDGGVIGSIGACRSVYLERNKTLSYAVAKAYAEAKPGTTMGEIFTIARRSLITTGMSSQLGANTLCYNYIGDPSMPMCIPEGNIVVETIFGAPYTGNEAVAPGLICEITGHVENPDGSLMSDFNGDVTIDLYRAPMGSATRLQDNMTRYPMLEDVLLTTCHGRITDGRLTALLTMPVSEAVWTPGRTILTAVDEATGKPVAGLMHGPGIGAEYIESPIAGAAPTFREFDISDGDKSADGTVAPDFNLEISINAPAGLAEGHANFLPRASIRLDGKRLDYDPTEGLTPDAEGNYNLSIPLNAPRHGQHNIAMSVTDRLGRAASANINFTVAPHSIPATLTIDAPQGFVRSSATFDAEASESTPQGRLVITDSHGKTVLSHPGVSFPFEWDLRDSEGKSVPDGHYRAALHSSTHTSQPISFKVIKSSD